jgi:hypothetical protein
MSCSCCLKTSKTAGKVVLVGGAVIGAGALVVGAAHVASGAGTATAVAGAAHVAGGALMHTAVSAAAHVVIVKAGTAIAVESTRSLAGDNAAAGMSKALRIGNLLSGDFSALADASMDTAGDAVAGYVQEKGTDYVQDKIFGQSKAGALLKLSAGDSENPVENVFQNLGEMAGEKVTANSTLPAQIKMQPGGVGAGGGVGASAAPKVESLLFSPSLNGNLQEVERLIKAGAVVDAKTAVHCHSHCQGILDQNMRI